LVTEAGGQFTDHAGKTDLLEGPVFVASNGKVQEELRSIVAHNIPGHLL
jgi:hypothetical protein